MSPILLLLPAVICFAMTWAFVEAAISNCVVADYPRAAVCGLGGLYGTFSFGLCIYGSIFF